MPIMPKHEFSVDMTCEGCSNTKVCINSEHSVDILLLETLEKTGKTVSYLSPK
ncbi:unnamed protein product [Nyctereutes procyonoides]|uniref:(raccoon dog) hypothetical protein n=1 Tax=Nyctereutes procyonoides TaxID=34880 RepID=A0A811Y1Z4_NYCPR|nr:unnamed protein product [Nyctereutes procyonoides]